MKIRLTDGLELNLTSCNQECDPESGENQLICTLAKGYDFSEVANELKKPEIAEILSIFMDGEDSRTIMTKDYQEVASISNDIKTNVITIKFRKRNQFILPTDL